MITNGQGPPANRYSWDDGSTPSALRFQWFRRTARRPPLHQDARNGGITTSNRYRRVASSPLRSASNSRRRKLARLSVAIMRLGSLRNRPQKARQVHASGQAITSLAQSWLTEKTLYASAPIRP